MTDPTPQLPPRRPIDYQPRSPGDGWRKALKIVGITLLSMVGVVVLAFLVLLGTCAMLK